MTIDNLVQLQKEKIDKISSLLEIEKRIETLKKEIFPIDELKKKLTELKKDPTKNLESISYIENRINSTNTENKPFSKNDYWQELLAKYGYRRENEKDYLNANLKEIENEIDEADPHRQQKIETLKECDLYHTQTEPTEKDELEFFKNYF